MLRKIAASDYGAKLMVTRTKRSPNLPAGAGSLARRFPKIWEIYAALGERCAEAGPLDARTRHLVKLLWQPAQVQRGPFTPTFAGDLRKG